MSLIANINTKIYKEIFGCYPDDEALKLLQIKKLKKTSVNT